MHTCDPHIDRRCNSSNVSRYSGAQKQIHIIFKLTAFRYANGCTISDITFERKCFIRSFRSFLIFRLLIYNSATTTTNNDYRLHIKLKGKVFSYLINENENYIPILDLSQYACSTAHLCIFLHRALVFRTTWKICYTREPRMQFIAHTLRLCSAHLNDLWCDSFQAINGHVLHSMWEIEKLLQIVSHLAVTSTIAATATQHIFAETQFINNRQLYANGGNRFCVIV